MFLVIRDADKDLLRTIAHALRQRAEEIRRELLAMDKPPIYDVVANSLDEQARVYEEMAK